MRIELWIIMLTAFFVYNTYHDGKYTKLLLSYKKYYQMGFYAIIGISIYLLLKRNPVKGRNMLRYANNVVKYLPIDKQSADMITPLLDLTNNNDRSFMEDLNNIHSVPVVRDNKMSQSGNKAVNRSVSGMKKKYVASQQDWKCGNCNNKLDYTYEIDHKVRLEHGGGNDVTNLIALCRECHGKKTVLETF